VPGRGVEERLLSLLPDLYALTPTPDFPIRAVTVTRRLLGGDKGVYTEFDHATGDFRALVDPVPVELAGLTEARIAFMPQHPVFRHVLAGGQADARTISDFLSPGAFRRLALYGEFFAPLGVADQITVLLTDRHDQRAAAVSVDRGRRGFDDQDRAALSLLRPHLAAARRNAQHFASASKGGTASQAERAAGALGRLTDRQHEILALVAAGRTNAQIARGLDLSPDTVRKHVENILARLGTTNRTSAAITYERARARHAQPVWTAEIPALVRKQ